MDATPGASDNARQESSRPVIVATDLRKRYDDIQAVDGVSFEVYPGEVFGMLGPNGAGKTTTVEMLEGMRDPDSGSALIDGIDVTREPMRVKKVIGVQLQANAFFDRLTLSELLKLFGTLYGHKVSPQELLDRVDLSDRGKAQFNTLSGGQKQRFSIAAALVNEPVVMFLDEPSTGLDPQARRNMWDLIKGLQADGTTVVLTTHYMEEAEELCDRVAIVDSGRIVALDTPLALVDGLLETGFRNERPQREATLEDVFISITGRALRDE
ncbi:MAG: ABC transporter ATP-binding protein [Dehalococcoidia bacterium]|nr:ABC transporter ATP-binding protein [Dehalococcoidia bacterium]